MEKKLCLLFFRVVKLDIVSPDRHMGENVPRIALTRPVLYFACLQYAAHIMVLRGELEGPVEERYHNKAIRRLIDSLASHPNPETDEALLATTVILRMSEQFSEIEEDAQHHLGGASSLFATNGVKWSPFQTDLRGTAFWIYLRESLRLCFLHEERCRFDMNLIEDEATFSPAPDEVWTNRMTHLLAKCCNVCFAEPDLDIQQGHLENLREVIDLWVKSLPQSFHAWRYQEEEFDPFPTVYFLSTWHGKTHVESNLIEHSLRSGTEIAWQQYYTAKVMLAVHTKRTYYTGDLLEINRYTEVLMSISESILMALT